MTDAGWFDWAGGHKALRGMHRCESIHSASSWGTRVGAHHSKLVAKWLIGCYLETMAFKLWIHSVEQHGAILDWRQSCQPEPVLSFGGFCCTL